MVLKMKLGKVIGWVYKDMELVERAGEEFFADFDEDVEFDPLVEGLFNEWLIFEFVLPSSRTPIVEYYLLDPDGLSEEELAELRQIVETARFEFLEILETKKGEWIRVLGVFTGKEYKIDERLGSMEHDKGCLWGRVAKVNGRWVFVGSDPLFLPVVYSERMRRILRRSANKESKKKMSAKDVLGFLVERTDNGEALNKIKQVGSSKKKVEAERKAVKKRFEVLKSRGGVRASFDEVVELIFNEDYGENHADFATDLVKLGVKEKVLIKEMGLFMRMWNCFSHKSLGGKSPVEMRGG